MPKLTACMSSTWSAALDLVCLFIYFFMQNWILRYTCKYFFQHVLKFSFYNLRFFKSFRNLVMCFVFSLKDISSGFRKIHPGKIPTHQTPAGKCPPPKSSPRKFPPGIFPPLSLSFFTTSSLNTSSINIRGVGKECSCNPPLMKNFDMPRKAQCFHLRKISNNQHKLTMYSDRFPSWNLSFVNIQYY